MSNQMIFFTLIDANKNQHEVAALVKDNSLKLVFPFYVNPDNKQAPTQVITFESPNGFNNPFGFITDRMHRMVSANPAFNSIIVGEQTHKLNPKYKEDKKVRDAVFINGVELKDGYTVRFAIMDSEDKAVSETNLNFYEVCDMASGKAEISPFLASSTLKTGKLPKDNDANGFPKFTKNLRTNRILFENGFFLNDYKELSPILNNHFGKLLEVAESTLELGYTELSMKLFDNHFKVFDVDSIVRRNKALLSHNDAGRTIKIESLMKQTLAEQPKDMPILVVYYQSGSHVHTWETDVENATSFGNLEEAVLSAGLIDATKPVDYAIYSDFKDDESESEIALATGTIFKKQ